MVKHQLITKPGIYFITFTCFRWFHLIGITNCYDIVYTFFDVLKSRNHSLIGYVIMPNHIHIIVHYTGGKSLNYEIGSGKRFMAYEIIKRLKKLKRFDILYALTIAVKTKDKSRGKKHEVWIDSFDVKQCWTEKFILQKLNYIHDNPCLKKWNLATRPSEYPWSSAAFYAGKKKGYPVTDYLDVLPLIQK